MIKSVTEKMHPEKEWFEEASKIDTIDGLASFVGHILNDYNHDYGTACHAVSACALAAAWVACEKEGLSGFQAGFVMWDFIKNWTKTGNECGLRLVDYDDMLYPQYEHKFDKVIDKITWHNIQEKAKENLNTDNGCGSVRNHWKKIVDGEVPFGYRVVEDL